MRLSGNLLLKYGYILSLCSGNRFFTSLIKYLHVLLSFIITFYSFISDPPIVAEPQQNVQVPHYLPDPRDGSIYQLGQMGSLKKLPYTIPQLVANAPCRSSDGILYSGKKSDTWYMVDPKTGRREKVMGFGDASMEGKDSDQIGWATSRAIYLGRTQYTVMMFDSQAKDKNAKPWNITFYDYNALSAPPELAKEYGNEINAL